MVVVDTHKQKCTKLAQYVEGSEYPLVWMVKLVKLRQVHGMISWDQVMNKSGTTNDINEEHTEGLNNMKIYRQLF